MSYKINILIKTILALMIFFALNDAKSQSISHFNFNNLQICDYNLDLYEEINTYNCQNSSMETELYVNFQSKIVTFYAGEVKYTFYINNALTANSGVILETTDIKDIPTRIYIFKDGVVVIRNSKTIITVK